MSKMKVKVGDNLNVKIKIGNMLNGGKLIEKYQ
jgi:hypothetical protein